MSVRIHLNRAGRVYHPHEVLAGFVHLNTGGSGLSHNGIIMGVFGQVMFQEKLETGLLDTLYSPLKPLKVLEISKTILEPGQIKGASIEIPFEILLEPLEGEFYESYNGVYINVEYRVEVTVKRTLPKRSLFIEEEFFIEILHNQPIDVKPFPFVITPADIVTKKKLEIPEFEIIGCIESLTCDVSEHFSGRFLIAKCALPIRSVELQLLRVESFDNIAREVTEIQNIQIVDGNVARDMEIPIYMQYPPTFTCITTCTKRFRLNFEINMIVYFGNGKHITQKFPLTLHRSK